MSFWFLDTVENIPSTDGIKRIISEASRELKEKTDGKIVARFGVIRSVSDMIAGIVESAASFNSGVVDGTSPNNLEDANSLYKSKLYGYELQNSTYRFRIFELKFMPVYPLTIRIDYDIYNSIKRRNFSSDNTDDQTCEIIIENETDFKDVFSLVLSDQKVQFIIQRMMALDKNSGKATN